MLKGDSGQTFETPSTPGDFLPEGIAHRYLAVLLCRGHFERVSDAVFGVANRCESPVAGMMSKRSTLPSRPSLRKQGTHSKCPIRTVRLSPVRHSSRSRMPIHDRRRKQSVFCGDISDQQRLRGTRRKQRRYRKEANGERTIMDYLDTLRRDMENQA